MVSYFEGRTCIGSHLYKSPNISRTVKSRILRWTRHVTDWGDKECIQKYGGQTHWKTSNCKTEKITLK
jgi:hypothetical protein